MSESNNETRIEMAMLSTRVDDIERRCEKKEAIVADIKDHIIPDAIERLMDHTIEPMVNRLRVIEGWNKYASGYAALFGVITMFAANKLWN